MIDRENKPKKIIHFKRDNGVVILFASNAFDTALPDLIDISLSADHPPERINIFFWLRVEIKSIYNSFSICLLIDEISPAPCKTKTVSISEKLLILLKTCFVSSINSTSEKSERSNASLI